MKRFFLGAALVLVGLVSGCDQFKDFSINEGLMNDYLLKKVHYQKKISIPGIANANITLGDLSSQIGRQNPEKIELSTQAKVQLATLLGTIQADMKLTIKAKPVFDAEKGAIFVKELEIVDYQTTPEKAAAPVKALIPYLNTSLSEFFDTHPVYVLNPEKSKAEAAASQFAKRLEIKPGKLVIGLTDK
ncbi:lipoprotein [Xenorhabdus bovienii]|uniref:Putative lipoprotein yceB n=1 Tax=Xenorhabdus bovienii str. Intermedium TaxID=1379677 RepID=A0A077QE99_XENBV|nr:lipoprotein [Xenorhabdus bovienii]MDE9431667.1 lipoprotein [Xenorhabdus bovienii]MDE9489392.1 lipoprotein [Xenorhabdus bovienii]MDE9497839.1 lipoprotein [Xenorhabdus bovienii]MDE9505917.1 lipoprotein [Xenorhabdus bovienii]MDE9546046.1 lipoprotein [Xenorhabdus bovienii]